MPEPTDTPERLIEGEVLTIQQQQRELEELQLALSENEQFTRFMELSKAVNDKMAEVREHIKTVMIPAYKEGKINKKVTGDWGFVTVTEEDTFEVDQEVLPAKYFKKDVDLKKIKAAYELEGKAPRGCVPVRKYGVMIKMVGKQE